MYEVKVKINGSKGYVKTLVRTKAKAEKTVAEANAYHGTTATWSKLF